jgi:sulfonate transport system substrate-binding protein
MDLSVEAGQLDVAFVGDVPEIIAKSNGLEVELFANLNSEAEMGIVAGKNSGIKKPTDLKGKKVVAAYGTVTHVYLNNLLQANGLSLDDVEVINDIANGGTLVASGNADAVVSTGTGVWQMSNSGVGDILTTSQGDAELSSQFFAMGRISYLKDNPDAAEAIIRALRKSKEYIEQNPEKAYEALATSDNPKEAGFDNLDPKIKEEQADRLNSIAKFLLGNGIISKDVDAKSAINNDYYEAASKTFTK